MNKITEKQKRFAIAYIKSLNATKAAKEAGYSEKTAYSIGSELLKKPEVRDYIQGQQDKIMDESILSTKQVLYLLSRIAKGEELEEREVILKKAEYMLNPSTNRQNLVYGDVVETVEATPKMNDRTRALDLLGKYHSLWKGEEQQLSGPIIINMAEWTDKDGKKEERIQEIAGQYTDRPLIINDIPLDD